MQLHIQDEDSPAVLMSDDAEFEFFEPKRVDVSPLELCLLCEDDELFEDD